MRGKKVNKVVQYVLLTLFFLILIGPLLWQLTLAFKGKGDDIYAIPPYLVPKDPTIDNFIQAFNTIPVLSYFKNSLIVAAISVCGNVIGATLAGYSLARLKFKGKTIVVLLIFSAMLIPHCQDRRFAEYPFGCSSSWPVQCYECAAYDECVLWYSS